MGWEFEGRVTETMGRLANTKTFRESNCRSFLKYVHVYLQLNT